MLDGESAAELLGLVPDLTEVAYVERWAASAAADPGLLDGVEENRETFCSLPADTCPATRFASAALLVDWVCYTAAANRVDLARLKRVIAAFPGGFRLWLCRRGDGRFTPVGYTGWYPVEPDAFHKAWDDPSLITSRGELVPLPSVGSGEGHVWLFNYCIVAPLRRSPQSRLMLATYAEDIGRWDVSGLAAAVLSPESVRVARRFGMSFRGVMTHEGASEDVYAWRRTA